MSYPSIRFRKRSEKKVSPYLQAFISIYGETASRFSTNIEIKNEYRWSQKMQKFENCPSKNQALAEIIATVEHCFMTLKRTNKIMVLI